MNNAFMWLGPTRPAVLAVSLFIYIENDIVSVNWAERSGDRCNVL
jgi:hypothetical protein